MYHTTFVSQIGGDLMKLNKNNTATNILVTAVSKNCLMRCTKLELKNIVFPKWDDLGLIGMMFRQCVRTKEQPTGNIYDEAVFQTVLRIIGGKVLMSERPDCYCWKLSKVQSAKDIGKIGTNSAEGVLNLCDILSSISDNDEKRLVADMFANMKNDLLLVTTPAEERTCIEITEELYRLGITHCVDEWMDVDSNGEAEATELHIGDYLIVTKAGVYRIGHDEFCETHKI